MLNGQDEVDILEKINMNIFVSHSSYDKALVQKISNLLPRHIKIWMDEYNLHGGMNLREEIQNAIQRKAHYFVLYLGKEAVESDWVKRELAWALEREKQIGRKFIVPVLLEEVWDKIKPEEFRQRLYLKCFDQSESSIRAFAGRLSEDLFALVSELLEEEVNVDSGSQARLLGWRKSKSAKDAMCKIVREVADCESKVLRILGVAHKDIFDVDSSLWNEIEDLLANGGRVEVLFMDPDSEAAARREEFELMPFRIESSVATRSAIKATLELAIDKSRHPVNNLIIKKYQHDASCFLLFNDKEMVIHPYFTSITGPATETLLVPRGSMTYDGGRQHFENLWQAKWVLIDIGNVLIDFSHEKVSDFLVNYINTDSARLLGRKPSREELHEFLFGSQGSVISPNNDLDIGKKSLEDLCDELCAEFRFSIDIELFEKYWSEIFDPLKPDGIQCIQELRQLGLRVGICSNTNPTHWRYLQKRDGLASKVDDCFLSFALQSRKPEIPFFIKICHQTKLPMSDHLLIDDKEENILGARYLGMQAEVFESFEKVVELVRLKGWDR